MTGVWSAKKTPCGSVNCAMRPPGTSIGPLMSVAPLVFARPMAESRSSTWV